MVDISSIIEGTVKFRDGKKWKSRWCVMRKLSPVADCLHLQLYRDSKDRYKNGQTKASLSLEHFLGVETGFTLDKESNTIAIICQDVIVVLAFDTRERLIQWQVKIANHLGDDIQYLILLQSAPSKAKIATGPAKMHVQDKRICLTTGVPPRLAGLWNIAHLRRYGVVDNRFCFEGGSSCGKGEGLYVFVTDLGEEITHTIKLAAKGNLSSKKRPYAKKLAGIDSPKKGSMSRGTSEIEEICTIHTNDSINDCVCNSSRMSYWPSQESRDLDSQYGCGDTVSVSEAHDSIHDMDNGFSRSALNNMERCMSCISKLGAMSRSSTITVGTPAGNGPNSLVWTTISEHYQMHQSSNTLASQSNKSGTTVLDRMSLCSHGSSNNSDYSVAPPRQTPFNTSSESWYEPAPLVQQLCNRIMSPPPPERPPKPGTEHCKSPNPSHIGPYENYDVPKIPTLFNTAENYDTPKKIQEYLAKDLNSNSSNGIDKYGNYDTPLGIAKAVCGAGCLGTSANDDKQGGRTTCACTKIMSWTDSWMCKRGNGIENTGVPVNKVKLTGEGKMPLMDASGESAIYATVDMAKKIKKRLEQCECDKEIPQSKVRDVMQNYANFDFERSLENYENAKEVLQRAGITLEEFQEEMIKICQKCGHASGSNTKTPDADTPVQEQPKPQENYLMMEPGSKKKANCPGYVPMHPAGQAPQVETPQTENGSPSSPAPPLPTKSDILKQRMNRIINEKSASNPSLVGPAVDRNTKRAMNNDNRVPGSAMMVLARNGTSPYNRKQIMDSSDNLPENRLTARKRSSSADSSRYLENDDFMSPLNGSGSPSTETLRKSSLTHIETRRASSPCVHQETELCQDASCCATPTAPVAPESDEISGSTSTSTGTTTSHTTSQSAYIRRSESVPCKAQNRDSSSSNDSGVSTGSLRQRGTDFNELELPLNTMTTGRRHLKQLIVTPKSQSCVHASLPRRSKSFDPLRDLSFQFQRVKVPEKSTSAEAEVPICPQKPQNPTNPPYIDSRSTSSGTSDMSDYIETLSLSSHSSSDNPDVLRQIRPATSTLRPRSGKEYQNIDRSLLSLSQPTPELCKQANPTGTLRANYANITPVPENAESPSPGYQSGTSPQEPQGEHFLFKPES
ncbi:uncharacterized protein LOC134826997 [Culicoides brevitarsis]|uniref:uncharacterized protein LOC134826997 n=1 Tax=Culicoides brevitarsis TaxID=469753 RepID=UPI00307C855E